MLDESDLLHTATGINDKNSAASSLTHSGRFNSEKGSDLISLDGGDEFNGGDPNERTESLPSEHLEHAQRFGRIHFNRAQDKLKKEEQKRKQQFDFEQKTKQAKIIERQGTIQRLTSA